MARGFKTGGRQKGTPNKATLWKRARAQEGLRLADEGGVTPLDIGREFSLEGMLDSFTQRKNVTVNLNTPPRD